MKVILHYSTPDPARTSWRCAIAAAGCFIIGAASLLLVGFGIIMLQDLLVGRVRDSHFAAWLFGVAPAGALAFIGAASSCYGMHRCETLRELFAVAAFVNSVALLVALIFTVLR